ncbi:MAG: aminotransferase class IV [Pseudomonadota bacterium]
MTTPTAIRVDAERRVPELSRPEVLSFLERLRRPYHANYLAMYSSLYGGIIRDPSLMMVPIDDHVVHRGDGVFETAKCAGGRLYQLRAHLQRLIVSANAIDLDLPASLEDLSRIMIATVRSGGSEDCYVRILATRGPGGFAPGPGECEEPQLYVVAYRAAAYGEDLFERGVRVITSRIPVKPSFFANVKSCNYLPNVLMKKEAMDRGVDYAVSVDERGYLAEGAAENLALVSKDSGRLCFPRFKRILQGITVSRLAVLAPGGGLGEPEFADMRLAEAFEASEMLLLGTSFDVLPVVELDGRPIGDGRPGPVFRRTREILLHDLYQNNEASEAVF